MNSQANYKKYQLPVTGVASALSTGWAQVLNVILPARCPLSGESVTIPGTLSPTAWARLTFIAAPYCTCCGVPFEISVDENAVLSTVESPALLCGDCIATPKPYTRARSALVYNDASRALILAFKHGDKMHLHITLGPLMAHAGMIDVLNGADALIPVPLHWLRLIKRRYNQAAVLAHRIGLEAELPVLVDTLIRTRHTPPQGHKGNRDRHANVGGAFDVSPTAAEKIKDKILVLVDDVFTTGATIEECAKTLLAAGAREVRVLTLARVVKAS